MKPSLTKNKTLPNGEPLTWVEEGDRQWFGGTIQKFFVVDKCENSRMYSGGIDLFQLSKDSHIEPINFTKTEFQL